MPRSAESPQTGRVVSAEVGGDQVHRLGDPTPEEKRGVVTPESLCVLCHKHTGTCCVFLHCHDLLNSQ